MTALLEALTPPTKASGDCCHTCPCTQCGSVLDASPLISTDRGGEKGDVVTEIMKFQFDPLVHRMVDKYGWTETEAREVFEDTKRFLALSATNKDTIVPPPKVDEMWHNFILFTEDYEQFCKTRVGRYIHHRPRRRNEVMTTREGKNPVKATLRIARATFGDLSQHWVYPMGAGDCGDCAPVACGHR